MTDSDKFDYTNIGDVGTLAMQAFVRVKDIVYNDLDYKTLVDDIKDSMSELKWAYERIEETTLRMDCRVNENIHNEKDPQAGHIADVAKLFNDATTALELNSNIQTKLVLLKTVPPGNIHYHDSVSEYGDKASEVDRLVRINAKKLIDDINLT